MEFRKMRFMELRSIASLKKKWKSIYGVDFFLQIIRVFLCMLENFYKFSYKFI